MKNDYEIRGEVTAIFIKTKRDGRIETIISTSDLKRAMEFPYTWHGQWNKQLKKYYAYSMLQTEEKRRMVRLHRWILNEPKGMVIDHINHDTLDNTRKNLRIVTQAQNTQNKSGAPKNSSTGIRGVCWKTDCQKYQARLQVNRKMIFVGYFDDIREAEKAVIEARRKHMPFSSTDQRVLS